MLGLERRGDPALRLEGLFGIVETRYQTLLAKNNVY